MATFALTEHPHRRYNPLTGEWILVSPHRTKRPWLGQVERVSEQARPSYDPTCYLCPGNLRAEGARNPHYEGTFIFDNDFAALLLGAPQGSMGAGTLLHAQSERGMCRVVCFAPDHGLTLPQMALTDIRCVIDAWRGQYEELGALPDIRYVQIFENQGALMGASNPHPHSQIWCNETIPQQPALEQAMQARYLAEHGTCLLCDYVALEMNEKARLVCQNEHFVALVPFWAVWPFEVMILSRRHLGSLSDFTDAESDALATVLKELTSRYDNLFQVSFPYTMGMHQRPTDGAPHGEWHFHMHFYPPLLRSATVRKFMVGYEMLANPQRDLTAESAAERLRALSGVRFS